jgi:hypothetical protein
MLFLIWWLRIVGLMYLVHFIVMVFVRAPIKTMGPADALSMAASGDPVAKFLVDTWVIFGLENLALGIALVTASFMPEGATFLVWLVIGIELSRGIAADIYMILRGWSRKVSLIWIAIHSAVIVTGILALRA